LRHGIHSNGPLLTAYSIQHSRAWLDRPDQLSALDRFCLLAWLEPVHACRHPTFALSPRPDLWGRRSKPSCCTSTLLRPIESILYARPLIGQLSQPACTLFVNPWLCQRVYRLMQVASLRLPVPSACTNQTRCSFRRQPAIRTIPLTFAPSLRVFGATFCRGRLDVICAGDCGSELDHAPPASFSAAFRYRFRRVRPDQCFPGLSLERIPADTGNAPGVSQTLRSLNPVTQVEDQSSCVLVARVPFHKSPPRQILVGGSTARSARPCFSIANRTWPLIAASGHTNLRQAGDD